jgi:hypothetical protein
MRSSGTPMPSLDTVRVALRKTTEALASELARPTNTAPQWSEFEWLTARAVAAIHGVSPLLSAKLLWHGPADWQQFLQEQKAHTTIRHQRIRTLLEALDRDARVDGIPMVALKGAALHTIGLYQPGERPMADVDLLVRGADMKATARVIEKLGYHESFAYWKHLVFAPNSATVPKGLGEHSDHEIKIELHHRIAEILPLRTTDATAAVFPDQPQPGFNAYPSTAALMAHLVLHAAGGMAYRSLRLLQLHDIALLCRRMTDSDWDELLTLGDGRRAPWWALPPLALTARYYRNVVPDRVLSALESACHGRLRRISHQRLLSDVSLSYPWIEAFPGLEWTQSLGEMWEHVANRTLRAARLLAPHKRSIAEGVISADSTWPINSQRPYILRWLISRPLRPATMRPIRAALEQHAGIKTI